jgi:3-dehydroquinate dehydratase
MKESQIIQKRIEALEAELATARQVLTDVTREEAGRGTSAERREYALELYQKILDLECDSMDIESDAVDAFISQVIDLDHRIEINKALTGSAYFGSMPLLRVCNDATVDKIISLLEACLDYIDDQGVLDIWLNYDPVTCTLSYDIEDEDEE